MGLQDGFVKKYWTHLVITAWPKRRIDMTWEVHGRQTAIHFMLCTRLYGFYQL